MGIPKCNWWVSYCLLTPTSWDIDSTRITYNLFISAGGPEMSMERRISLKSLNQSLRIVTLNSKIMMQTMQDHDYRAIAIGLLWVFMGETHGV